MIARLTVAEVAAAVRCHENTVRLAAQAGELHGIQRTKGGPWTFREDCAEAWADGRPCEHQASKVTPIRSQRSA